MTAGKGIAHSERSPAAARKAGPQLHGLQLWAALPAAAEDVPPSFQHHAASDIPELTLAGARLRVIAGSAFGAVAPLKVSSSLFYVEVRLEGRAEIHLPEEYAERAAYVVQGAVLSGGSLFRSGTMVVFREKADARLTATESSRLMLLGGSAA